MVATIGTWLREGFRTAFFRGPRSTLDIGVTATPAVVAVIILLAIVLAMAGDWVAIKGAADFNGGALVHGWLGTAVLAWTCWWIARRSATEVPPNIADHAHADAIDGASIGHRSSEIDIGASTLFTLVVAQGLVIAGFAVVIYESYARGVQGRMPEFEAAWTGWVLWWLLFGWGFAAELRLLTRFLPQQWLARLFVAGLLAVLAVVTLVMPQQRFWYPHYDASDKANQSSLFRLTPELIEQQVQAREAALQTIKPGTEGQINLFAITFAPYAGEDVFRRESELVARVMADRFEAGAQTIQLVNHAQTAATVPWATAANLRRAIHRVAELMNRDEDVLFIHLTSHGAKSGALSADFWPMEVASLKPGDVRAWLDEAGIRYRVISVSACYSGTWIAPLQSDATMVMTAADAEHTSYGCGRRSAMTYFGQAMFDEALQTTWSFERAHAMAREVIEKRETQAGKKDGFSNPQYVAGPAIKIQLERLADRLAASAAANALPLPNAQTGVLK